MTTGEARSDASGTDSGAPPESPSEPRSEKQWWTIGIVSLASLMVGLDVLVLMTALPTMRVELQASTADLGWTINAYEIGYAALILTGATLGDRFGRRLLFLLSVGLFTIGSAAAAVSPSIEWLIAARSFQGVGGGVATAMALALISSVVPPAQRGAAFGIWGAVTGMAVALGPIVGGAIVHALTWEWIFWINVPIGIALIGLTLSRVEESKGARDPIDYVGVVLSAVGVVAVAQGLLRGGDEGWSEPTVAGGIVGGLIVLAAFVLWEKRAPAPMMPLSLFRNASFAGGCAAGFALGAALYGQAFMFAQYLQFALNQDALGVGLRLLPWVSLAPIVAPIAGQLTDRIGERPLVILGMSLFAVAFFVIAPTATATSSYSSLVIPLVLAGVGVSMTYVTTVSAVMRAVEPERLGIASGVANTIRQVGAVFGVAVGIAVFSSYGDFTTPEQFVDGYSPAAFVLAGITLLGVLPALAIRKMADGRPSDEVAEAGPVPTH